MKLIKTIKMTIEERIRYLIEDAISINRLTRMSCFILDFTNQRLLWKSDKLLFIDGVTEKLRTSINPYWEYTSDNTYSQLSTISMELCRVVENRFTDKVAKLTCVVDYPVLCDGQEMYISQETLLMLLPDIQANVMTENLRIISFCTVNISVTKSLSGLIVMSDGGIYKYDKRKGRFAELPANIRLSDREKSILSKTEEGYSPKEIAAKLCISDSTLKTHKSHIFHKLHTHNIEETLDLANKLHLM